MDKNRAYSKYTIAAAHYLGKAIRLGRIERNFTSEDLAKRAGISRGTLVKIEKGDLHCELGLYFEVADLVGIKLFDADKVDMSMQISQFNDKIALLPKRIRSQTSVVKDDF